MDVVALWSEGRQRMLALAAELSEAEAATPVPACPGWAVKDVYAHLAGAATDILAGRLEGVATDPWTAKQVADRADRSLSEVCAEFEEAAPRLEELLRSLGDMVDPRLLIDQWTHEQDVRGAVGRAGARDVPAVAFSVGKLVGGLRRRAAEVGAPPLRIVGSSREWAVGEGPADHSVRATDFELARSLIGRRSDAQIRAYDWDGDPEPYLPIWNVFPKPPTDLPE